MDQGCCSSTSQASASKTSKEGCGCHDEPGSAAPSAAANAMPESITPDMTIGEVVEKHPQLAEIFTKYGLHCVGCHVSPYETLEQGSMGHGMLQEDFDAMLEEANAALKKHSASPGLSHSPHSPAQGVPHPAQHATITVTASAFSKAKALFDKAGVAEAEGLRIKVVPGGCSGFSYKFGFDKSRPGDIIINNAADNTAANSIDRTAFNVFVDPQSMSMLKDSTIDYVETLQESGFKIKNPNAASACGCGSSFR